MKLLDAMGPPNCSLTTAVAFACVNFVVSIRYLADSGVVAFGILGSCFLLSGRCMSDGGDAGYCA